MSLEASNTLNISKNANDTFLRFTVKPQRAKRTKLQRSGCSGQPFARSPAVQRRVRRTQALLGDEVYR